MLTQAPLVMKAFVFGMLFCLEGTKKVVHYEFLTYFARNVFTKINVQTLKKCEPNYGQNVVMMFLSKVCKVQWTCEVAKRYRP
jgi:hypothetical protein